MRAIPFWLSALPAGAAACPECRPLVRAAVYGGAFWPTLALLLLPLLIVAGAAAALHRRRDGGA